MFLSSELSKNDFEILLKNAAQEAEIFKIFSEENISSIKENIKKITLEDAKIKTSKGDSLLLFAAFLGIDELVNHILSLDKSLILQANQNGNNALILSIESAARIATRFNLLKNEFIDFHIRDCLEQLLIATFADGNIYHKNKAGFTAKDLVAKVISENVPFVMNNGILSAKFYNIMINIIKYTKQCDFACWDTFYTALKSFDILAVQLMLKFKPELLFEKNRYNETPLFRLKLNEHTMEEINKILEMINILNNAYYELLNTSSISEKEISFYNEFINTIQDAYNNHKKREIQIKCQHDIILNSIANNLEHAPSKCVYPLEFSNLSPINRPFFIHAFKLNKTVFNLTVDYDEALNDIKEILLKNKTITQLIIGTNCHFSEEELIVFINSLNQSNVNSLEIQCSLSQNSIISLLKCQNIQTLQIKEPISWNKYHAEALAQNIALKEIDFVFKSGIVQFLNLMAEKKFIEVINCAKKNYFDELEKEGFEVEAIKGLILKNSTLKEAILDFSIADNRKLFIAEALSKALTKNETLKKIVFDPIDSNLKFPIYNDTNTINSIHVDILEHYNKIFLENYVLEDIIIRNPLEVEKRYFLIQLGENSLFRTSLVKSLHDNIQNKFDEIFKSCLRNKKLVKMLKHIDDAVFLFNVDKIIEAEAKIKEAINEAKLTLGEKNGLVEAEYILGRVLLKKFSNFKKYAFDAFNNVSQNNPYYLKSKYEIISMIRSGDKLLSFKDALVENLEETEFNFEKNQMSDIVSNLKQDELMIDNSIKALPHLIEIKKMEESKILNEHLSEKINVNDEIHSLATRYVNCGFKHNPFDGTGVALPKNIDENPETILNLLEVIKEQREQLLNLQSQINNIGEQQSINSQNNIVSIQFSSQSSGLKRKHIELNSEKMDNIIASSQNLNSNNDKNDKDEKNGKDERDTEESPLKKGKHHN